MAGCSIVGGSREPVTIFAPDSQVAADPAWPQVDWQMTIGQPTAARMVDSVRIAVRPVPGELQVYKGAIWAKSPDLQLQDALLRTLEDSGRIAGVARQGSGLAADFRLELDLRRYDADYTGNAVPAATIEVNAKLLHSGDREIAASRTFTQAVPAASTDIASVAQAFGQALGMITHDIAGWTLQSGTAHQRTEKTPAP
ncbi:MAG: ABC-type transport auxiliary lipoprotein family protein [Luteimonas sp.]